MTPAHDPPHDRSPDRGPSTGTGRPTVRVAIPTDSDLRTRFRDPLARAWQVTTAGTTRSEAWVTAIVERQRGRHLDPFHVVAHARRLNASTVTFTITHERPAKPRTTPERLRDLYDPPRRWQRRHLRRARRHHPGPRTS